MQRYWLKAAPVFWSHAHDASNGMLTRVLNNEWELGRVCRHSWSARLRLFMRDWLNFPAFPEDGEAVVPVPMQCVDAFMTHLVQQRQQIDRDPRLPAMQHRAPYCISSACH
jgi:hypothetical protein